MYLMFFVDLFVSIKSSTNYSLNKHCKINEKILRELAKGYAKQCILYSISNYPSPYFKNSNISFMNQNPVHSTFQSNWFKDQTYAHFGAKILTEAIYS